MRDLHRTDILVSGIQQLLVTFTLFFIHCSSFGNCFQFSVSGNFGKNHLCVPFFVGRFVRETCTPLPTHVVILDREIHTPFMCPIFCREIC
jgi:hypothetical protein